MGRTPPSPDQSGDQMFSAKLELYKYMRDIKISMDMKDGGKAYGKRSNNRFGKR